MANFCLPKELTTKFLTALRSGELDPATLKTLSSAERRAAFEKIVGKENAGPTNALFEQEFARSQKSEMIAWVKQVAGLKEPVRRDIIAQVERMKDILNPTSKKTFLQDLASKKLGADVSMEEVQHITDLSQKIATARAALDKGGDRMNYGRAVVELQDYVNGLKSSALNLSVKEFKANPGAAGAKAFGQLGGLAKSLKASLDVSGLLRQGFKTLVNHPDIWLKDGIKYFDDAIRSFGGKAVMKEVRADILSRPNALNGLYAKEKLAVGVTEEAYPTNLPEKIPGLGRAFKASEESYTAFQYRTRADIFDKLVDVANKVGGDTKGLGKIANSLSGRGSFGERGESLLNFVNGVFFSPRYLKSNVDILTAHAFDKNIGSFARKEALKNTVRTVGAIAIILTIANALKPGSVEKDLRSADSGKVKVGNTRFDITAGISPIVTLAARIATLSTKSTTTGKVNPLNSGAFGAPTVMDMLVQFAGNRASPLGGIFRDIANGQDPNGNKVNPWKPTLGMAGQEASNLLMPLPITDYQNLSSDPNAAPILAGMIASELGIGVNDYAPKKKKN